jgi:hypothetical protein
VAVIIPARSTTAKQQRGNTKEDYDAFFAAFGSWKDVDTDTLNKQIAEQRKHSNRPPLEL